jgi:biotin-dependent carboxylase-like uncharacterized protein
VTGQPTPGGAPATVRAPEPALEVLAPGPLSTVQDLGRPGWAALGVGRSGAADRGSLRLANRLVGNPEDAAAVEVTFGGLAVRASADLVVAVTGAPAPLRVGGHPRATHAAVLLAAGQEAVLEAPPAGLRSYLAVRGGLAVEPVLGSRSTDVLAGLGPPPLRAGDRLPVGPPPAAPVPVVDVAAVVMPGGDDVVLRAVPGPRADWFAGAALDVLGATRWVASADSDRVGVRLDGGRLERSRTGELPSEGMVAGALQVPPSGQPVLLLADAPTTGGYPVVAVVLAADVDRAAQLRPGQGVRVRLTSRPARPDDPGWGAISRG